MTTKGICDLPYDLVGDKILSKVPTTSLREVRSTCKLWDRLTKDWILGKEAARQHQFLGFITVDNKICSLRSHLRRKEEEGDPVDHDLSIKQVDLLNHVEITKVFHCDGLLLCVVNDCSKLVAWNPYLGQTRPISPRTCFYIEDNYLFGYDMNRNHKILRFLNYHWFYEGKPLFLFDIYDFSSNSWRVLDVRPDWEVQPNQRGVSLKGNTFFWAHEKVGVEIVERYKKDRKDFLLCFDFTTERLGEPLPLPFHSRFETTVTLSSFRDEKLALLHQIGVGIIEALEIWVTAKIEPNNISWSKFIDVDMRPLIGNRLVRFDERYGSFFIDEEEKVAVVFDIDGYESTKTAHYHTAFIIGDDGYNKTVNLGEAPNIGKPLPGHAGYTRKFYSPPLVCSSSYLPSLVQLNQRDEC